MTGKRLEYIPLPERVLSAMRERKQMLADELFNGELPFALDHVFEVAWREACLHCLDEIKTMGQVVKMEKIEWQEPARAYLERVYEEIMKDNALTPYINYED